MTSIVVKRTMDLGSCFHMEASLCRLFYINHMDGTTSKAVTNTTFLLSLTHNYYRIIHYPHRYSHDTPSKASGINTTIQLTESKQIQVTMNSLPEDFSKSMNFSFMPLSGGFASSDFADSFEQFDSVNDPFFDFEHVDFDLAMSADLPFADSGCIDPSLLMNEYPDPLIGLQATSYPYPQSLPDERDYEPQGLLSFDYASLETLPLASQKNLATQTHSPMAPIPAMGSEPSPSRIRKSRVARPSKEKSEKPEDSSIDMPVPLSRLFPDISLADAETYIRRPKELREAEWRTRRGFPKMPRPVNAFLLYRRAVSEKAKHFAGVENHQVVSKLAGVSWKNESDEVKDTFSQYAELEKQYHGIAFPDYKYKPKRLQPTKGTKSKGKGDDSDENDGDELFALPNPRRYQALLISRPNQGQKCTDGPSKRVREESPQTVSPPAKPAPRPRTTLTARGSIRSAKGSVKSPVRQLSKRLRSSSRNVNYAEDSDSEDDEPVRTSKRRRPSPVRDTIEVKW